MSAYRSNLTPGWKKIAFRTMFVCTLSMSGPAMALDTADMMAQVDAQLEQHYAHLDALYKEIHQHPELAFQETATAAKLAKEMRALGFEVTERVGKTGLVAVLRHGDGPTVMVRTELDALPMEEKTGLPYASHVHAMWNGRDVPVAHTCRHDVHMAAWIGTAQVMAAMKAQWRGTLMFIAQPAEETGLGAQAMIDDGLFTRFGKPDIGCALHVVPAPAGVVIYGAGMATSNMDSLEIIFRGRGGHGAAPDAAIDPVLEAGRFIVDVQSVVSREKDPAAFGVVTIGALQAGSVGNIIPDQAELRGTIRSYDLAVREKMLAGVKRTANAVADMAGAARPEVVIGREAAKAVVNDGAISARTGQLFQSAFGKDVVPATKPTSASEDYSAFIAAGVPSLFFGIGALDLTVFVDAKSGKPIPSNHSPYFAPLPEPTIRRAVEAMSLAILGALQQ